MIVALLWLTVSTPFVYAASQVKKEATQKGGSEKSSDDSSPFSGTEEKSETGVSSISEYLHEAIPHERAFTFISTFYKCHPSDLYFEYHPELISPPPEA